MATGSIVEIVFAWACGMALGVLHFGSLWWVVQSLTNARRPGVRLAASSVVRFAVTLSVLYLFVVHGWQPMIACVVGLLTGRSVVVRVTRWRPREAGG